MGSFPSPWFGKELLPRSWASQWSSRNTWIPTCGIQVAFLRPGVDQCCPGGKWVDGLGNCKIGSPRNLLGQQVPKRKWWGKEVMMGLAELGGQSSQTPCIWATWPQVPQLQPPGWYDFRFVLSERNMTWTTHMILDFFSSQARDKQRETKQIG